MSPTLGFGDTCLIWIQGTKYTVFSNGTYIGRLVFALTHWVALKDPKLWPPPPTPHPKYYGRLLNETSRITEFP